MNDNQVIPAACNPDIFKNGQRIGKLFGTTQRLNEFVQAVSQNANAQIDWFYANGVAVLLHLGDQTSLEKVRAALKETETIFEGKVHYHLLE